MKAAGPILLNLNILKGHGHCRNPSSSRSIGDLGRSLQLHCKSSAGTTNQHRPPLQEHICQKSCIEHAGTTRSFTTWKLGVPLRSAWIPAVSQWQDGQTPMSQTTTTSIGADIVERPTCQWEDAWMVVHHAGFTLSLREPRRGTTVLQHQN